MWLWERRRPKEGFPPDFSVQKVWSTSAKAISDLTGPEIAAYFRQRPSVAEELLAESYDKRFSPSTFLAEEGDEYRVGWFSRSDGYQCEKRFSNLADAATDYLLFSFGKGRWSPPDT